MNATAEVLKIPGVLRRSRVKAVERSSVAPGRADWDQAAFAQEQIRSLVAQLFVPGWPKPARQVVFCGVDANSQVAELCRRVACELARQTSGRVGLVEANPAHELEGILGDAENDETLYVAPGSRVAGKQLGKNLWLVPQRAWAGDSPSAESIAGIREGLDELRREFDYTVIHGPPAGASSQAAQLGSAADGVVLVLEAHVTRRVTALRAKEALQSANARLLGLVLDQRRFPIPQRIYRRL